LARKIPPGFLIRARLAIASLAETVIVDQDVGSDHQIERLPLAQFRPLRDDIQIQWSDTRRGSDAMATAGHK
jgi:hypothetical protein